MSDPTSEFLSGLSLEQLDDLQAELAKRAEARQMAAVQRKRAGYIPPLPVTDVTKAAESLGLDISGLMRDVKRRSS